MTKVYTALVERGEATWTARIQDLPDGKTALAMGKNWKQLRTLAQEACGHAVGLLPDEVVVDLILDDPDLQALIEEAKVARAALRAARFEADATLGRAARRLSHLATVRDIAEMLGCSYQHVAKNVPRDAMQKAEDAGDTPEDWARMLYLVAGMRTPASGAELAREARSWVRDFPDDPEFLRRITEAHRALVQERSGES